MVATKADPICSKNALKNVDLQRIASEATFEPPPLGLGAFLAGAQQWPPLARLQAFKSSQLRWNTDCSQRRRFTAALDSFGQPLRSDLLVVAPNMRSRGLVEKCGDTTCQVRVRELG